MRGITRPPRDRVALRGQRIHDGVNARVRLRAHLVVGGILDGMRDEHATRVVHAEGFGLCRGGVHELR